MFERFDRDLRTVVIAGAVAEAEQRNDPRIGTEHLLLSLAATPGPYGSAFFEDIGADHRALAAALDDLDGESLSRIGVIAPIEVAPNPSRSRWPWGRHVPFTGGAKDTLRRSLQFALGRNDRRIGTEHLLLALTSAPQPDLASTLLRRLGLDPAAIHATIERRLRPSA